MRICAIVRMHGTEIYCEPSCIYDCRHQKRKKLSFGSCVLVFLWSQGCVLSCATHLSYLTTLFVRSRDWSENQSPFKGINREEAAERAFLLLHLYVYCEVCMSVSARACARCQHERQAWKGENWLHHFDGLNSLKMALLSKISRRSKLSNLCLFRY